MNSRRSSRCGCPSFMPPFSARSGGSGPRRAGRLCQSSGWAMTASIIRATDARLSHPARHARRSRRARPSPGRDVHRHGCRRGRPGPGCGVSRVAAHDDARRRVRRLGLRNRLRGEIVAGGGISLLRWPPGPRPAAGDRLAFVYNVYTEPAHRKRGLARSLMEAIHAWCAEQGIAAMALNAARRRPPSVRVHGLLRGAQPDDVQDDVIPTCPGLAKPPAFR